MLRRSRRSHQGVRHPKLTADEQGRTDDGDHQRTGNFDREEALGLGFGQTEHQPHDGDEQQTGTQQVKVNSPTPRTVDRDGAVGGDHTYHGKWNIDEEHESPAEGRSEYTANGWPKRPGDGCHSAHRPKGLPSLRTWKRSVDDGHTAWQHDRAAESLKHSGNQKGGEYRGQAANGGRGQQMWPFLPGIPDAVLGGPQGDRQESRSRKE